MLSFACTRAFGALRLRSMWSLSRLLQMLVTMIDDDPFVGRIATGRIASGVVSLNDRVKVITRDGTRTSTPDSARASAALCVAGALQAQPWARAL